MEKKNTNSRAKAPTDTMKKEGCCSSGRSKMHGPFILSLIVILCTATGVYSMFFVAQSVIGPSISDAFRQVQYDQAGGKDIYDLYVKMAKLQSASQIKTLEDKIAALEKGTPDTTNNPQANANPEPQAAASKTLDSEERAAILKDSYVEGNKGAKITLIEYSDLECPYCIMQYKNGTVGKLKEKYGSSVNVIFKPLNLARHSGSDQKGMAALCVAKIGGADKYAKYYQAILGRSDERGTLFSVNNLKSLAKEVGVNEAAFSKCYDAQETSDVYKSYTTEAMKHSVNGTPSIMVVNNETGKYDVVVGAAPVDQFTAKIDALLK